MKKLAVTTALLTGLLLVPAASFAQFKDKNSVEEAPKSKAELLLEEVEASQKPVVITLEQALEIALSENVSVKVSDLEIKRTEYAKKGAYAALYPQIDLAGSYQRTIKKQVMYMAMGGVPTKIEVGMFNTLNAAATAALPLVNAQVWNSLKISALDVELAVEKARASRLDMVTQVKNAYFGILLAKEAFNVYKEVYENAVENYNEAQMKYDAQKVSEFELVRAKTSVANAIPNVYNAESTVILALWQLKAVLGVDLEMNIDVAGKLEDWSQHMLYDIHQHEDAGLANNTTMKQLAIQVEQLAQAIKLQKAATLPSLAASFNFS